ncbi:uncharacterized protein Dvir_GJ18331 [Drosophila virilis]|uniref:C-type lectin domain-containing protein n=1 Tax=Drosophila virilis TaxID=7244 RepID=B4M9J6_DROVI|nr:C-type lectin 37Da [Drosophila virilis]EDW57872.2 uncharacterized protein Dvir_GJ18331 [Drosophila virilis]
MFGHSLALFSTLSVVAIVLADPVVPPAEFAIIQNGIYYFETNTAKNWFDASEACHRMSAELVTFETLEEWKAVNKYIADKNIDGKYWTSGTDLAVNGKHSWFTTGLPLNINIWAPGEPNNRFDNEHCDHIHNTLGLNDYNCNSVSLYICEARRSCD